MRSQRPNQETDRQDNIEIRKGPSWAQTFHLPITKGVKNDEEDESPQFSLQGRAERVENGEKSVADAEKIKGGILSEHSSERHLLSSN